MDTSLDVANRKPRDPPMIAAALLALFFVLGGISLLGIIGGPLEESPHGWVQDLNAPPPPIGKSLLGDPDDE